MKFIKFKHKWSHGIDEEWTYQKIHSGWEHAIGDKELFKEFLDENIAAEFDYYEHYRGVDYEIIDRPPNEWLQKEIDKLEAKALHCNDLAGEYRELLKENE